MNHKRGKPKNARGGCLISCSFCGKEKYFSLSHVKPEPTCSKNCQYAKMLKLSEELKARFIDEFKLGHSYNEIISNESIQELIFWSRVEKTSNCWNWLYSKDDKGYGIHTIKSKFYRSHVLSWEYTNNKKVSKGEEVCHSCDNPSCVNPNHLFIGTHQDNMKDCVSKNRNNFKYSNSLILAIQNDFKFEVLNKKELSKKYNIPYSTVKDIISQKHERYINASQT